MGGRPARCTRSIKLRVAAFSKDRALVWWLLMRWLLGWSVWIRVAHALYPNKGDKAKGDSYLKIDLESYNAPLLGSVT